MDSMENRYAERPTGRINSGSLNSVPEFYGRRSESAECWLETLGRLASPSVYHWDENTMLEVAMLKMRDKAAIWLNSLDTNLCWPEFEVLFLYRFGETIAEALSRLAECKQYPDESIQCFTDRFKSNALAAGRREDGYLVYQYLDSIRADLRVEGFRQYPWNEKTITELATKLQSFEAMTMSGDQDDSQAHYNLHSCRPIQGWDHHQCSNDDCDDTHGTSDSFNYPDEWDNGLGYVSSSEHNNMWGSAGNYNGVRSEDYNCWANAGNYNGVRSEDYNCWANAGNYNGVRSEDYNCWANAGNYNGVRSEDYNCWANAGNYNGVGSEDCSSCQEVRSNVNVSLNGPNAANGLSAPQQYCQVPRVAQMSARHGAQGTWDTRVFGNDAERMLGQQLELLEYGYEVDHGVIDQVLQQLRHAISSYGDPSVQHNGPNVQESCRMHAVGANRAQEAMLQSKSAVVSLAEPTCFKAQQNVVTCSDSNVHAIKKREQPQQQGVTGRNLCPRRQAEDKGRYGSAAHGAGNVMKCFRIPSSAVSTGAAVVQPKGHINNVITSLLVPRHVNRSEDSKLYATPPSDEEGVSSTPMPNEHLVYAPATEAIPKLSLAVIANDSAVPHQPQSKRPLPQRQDTTTLEAATSHSPASPPEVLPLAEDRNDVASSVRVCNGYEQINEQQRLDSSNGPKACEPGAERYDMVGVTESSHDSEERLTCSMTGSSGHLDEGTLVKGSVTQPCEMPCLSICGAARSSSMLGRADDYNQDTLVVRTGAANSPEIIYNQQESGQHTEFMSIEAEAMAAAAIKFMHGEFKWVYALGGKQSYGMKKVDMFKIQGYALYSYVQPTDKPPPVASSSAEGAAADDREANDRCYLDVFASAEQLPLTAAHEQSWRTEQVKADTDASRIIGEVLQLDGPTPSRQQAAASSRPVSTEDDGKCSTLTGSMHPKCKADPVVKRSRCQLSDGTNEFSRPPPDKQGTSPLAADSSSTVRMPHAYMTEGAVIDYKQLDTDTGTSRRAVIIDSSKDVNGSIKIRVWYQQQLWSMQTATNGYIENVDTFRRVSFNNSRGLPAVLGMIGSTSSTAYCRDSKGRVTTEFGAMCLLGLESLVEYTEALLIYMQLAFGSLLPMALTEWPWATFFRCLPLWTQCRSYVQAPLLDPG